MIRLGDVTSGGPVESVTCTDCGEQRSAFETVILGQTKTYLTQCACYRKRDERIRAENPGALRRIVEERSRTSREFADATIASHPDAKARKIGEWYVDKVAPNPLERLLALGDWNSATPEQRMMLASVQRDIMRGVMALGLIGLRGRGKSGLVYAIGAVLRERGIPFYGWNVRLLLDECKARYSDKTRGTVDALFAPLRNAPALFLDDIDKAHSDSQDEVLKLYAVVEHRVSEGLPTYVTANRSPAELDKMFSEKFGENGGAIIDRMAKSTKWYELQATRSYRLPPTNERASR